MNWFISILAFLNMTQVFDISFEQITNTAAATIGVDAFFTILTLSFVLLGYATATNRAGVRNIATIPVFTIIACIMFSLMIPTVSSIILWVLGVFLAGGSVLWKVAIKRRGEY